MPCGGLLDQQTSDHQQHVESEGFGQDESQAVYQQVAGAQPQLGIVWTVGAVFRSWDWKIGSYK